MKSHLPLFVVVFSFSLGTWVFAAGNTDLPDPGTRNTNEYIRLETWKDISIVEGGELKRTDVLNWAGQWSKTAINELKIMNLDLKLSKKSDAVFFAEVDYTVDGIHDTLIISGALKAIKNHRGGFSLKIIGYEDITGSNMIRAAWFTERVEGAEDAVFEEKVTDTYTMKMLNELIAPVLAKEMNARETEILKFITRTVQPLP